MESVKRVFQGNNVSYCTIGNNSIVTVKCKMKKKLEFTLKPLIINGRSPQIRTFFIALININLIIWKGMIKVKLLINLNKC